MTKTLTRLGLAALALPATLAAAQEPADPVPPMGRVLEARDISPSVRTQAQAAVPPRGAVSLTGTHRFTRRGQTAAEAEAAVQADLKALRAREGDVRIERERPQATVQRVDYERISPADSARLGAKRPVIWEAAVALDVRAPSQLAYNAWAREVGPAPSLGGPMLTATIDPDDPAWREAAETAYAQAVKSARIAADVAGGELGPVLSVDTSRRVMNYEASVSVSATFQLRRKGPPAPPK